MFRMKPTVWLDSLLQPRPAESIQEWSRSRRATRDLPPRKLTATSSWRFLGGICLAARRENLQKDAVYCFMLITTASPPRLSISPARLATAERLPQMERAHRGALRVRAWHRRVLALIFSLLFLLHARLIRASKTQAAALRVACSCSGFKWFGSQCPIFSMTRLRCSLTVRIVIPKSLAISLLSRPENDLI